MKVIDLLNKIANGEYPTIKDGINKYHYQPYEKDYVTGMEYDYELYFSNIDNILEVLNDEIEIIEDTPKENKKIDRVSLLDVNTDYKLKDILNEIIDKVNGE